MPSLDFYDKGPDRPWINTTLTTAAIVGETTENSSRLWVRVWAPGSYCLIVSETPIPRADVTAIDPAAAALILKFNGASLKWPAIVQPAKFEFSTDLTGIFNVEGLKPGSVYYYAVVQANPDEGTFRWELPPDPALRQFCTRKTDTRELSFAFYSCHMPYKKNGELGNIHMWEVMREEMERCGSAFAIGGGDQVYTDGTKKVSIWRWLKKVKDDLPADDDQCLEIMRSWYRDIYRGYWGTPQVRRFFERFPNYMIWDDHEIKDGWGSYTKDELADELDSIFEWQNTAANLRLANLMFKAATATYLEYQHSHNPPTAPGVFDYCFTWGEWPFYILDMRGQRDFNRPENKILGIEQMHRFKEWLAAPSLLSAPALFIVSPVPLVHISSFVVNHLDIPLLGLADDLRDEWEHESNWAERNQLLDLVFEFAQTTGKPVVFLSGDVHVAAAFRLFRPKFPQAKVYQLTSSGITYAARPPGLELVVRERGTISDSEERAEKDPIYFRLLHRVVATNNFALISATRTAGVPQIKWDVYANTGEGDDLMGLKTVVITE